MTRSAVLAAAILAAISFRLRDVARTESFGPPTSEPAPQVEPVAEGVLDLFKRKRVVALSDWHGLAQEEAFYSALIRDPRFTQEVGNVVVEFG